MIFSINFEVHKTVAALVHLIKVGDLTVNKIKHKDKGRVIEIENVI